MDGNVAAHLQRLQLGSAGPRGRRRARPTATAAGSATARHGSDPHACMRRLLACAFRSTDKDVFRRPPLGPTRPACPTASPVFQVAFARAAGLQSRAQRLLAAVDEDGAVAVLDTAAAEGSHRAWVAHDNAIFDLDWAHDNAFVLTAAGDLRATAWDVETQRARFSLVKGHTMSLKCVRQSADQPDTIATGARDGHVLVWDARASSKPVAELRGVHSEPVAPPPTPRPTSSPNVHFLSPPSARKRRKPNSAATPPSASKATPRSVTSVAFLGGGHELATAGAVDGVVKIWDLRRLTAPRKIPLQSSVRSASTPVRTFACGSGGAAQRGITSLALDPGSRARLLVSVLHGELCVLDADARSGAAADSALRLEGHVASSFYVKAAFSPDGDFVVSGSGDGAVYVWDARRGRGGGTRGRAPLLALKAHDAEVNGVAWHASDFGTLATGSDDGTVRVWRADRRALSTDSSQGFRLRRQGGAWQNWDEWETQCGGRAYGVDVEDEVEDVATTQSSATASSSEPEPPVTPVAVARPAMTTPASARKRRAAPQTLFDFWGPSAD